MDGLVLLRGLTSGVGKDEERKRGMSSLVVFMYHISAREGSERCGCKQGAAFPLPSTILDLVSVQQIECSMTSSIAFNATANAEEVDRGGGACTSSPALLCCLKLLTG